MFPNNNHATWKQREPLIVLKDRCFGVGPVRFTMERDRRQGSSA